MFGLNKKVIVFGLIIVVLGLWINSTLGYQGYLPEDQHESVDYIVQE